MRTKLEVPTFDWFERYKLQNHAAWSVFAAAQSSVLKKFGEEGFKQFEDEFRPNLSFDVGKKLVGKLELKPDIEGVLKLIGAYTQEVWGYGDPRFVEVFKESPDKGSMIISVCRGWAKWHKDTGVDCSHRCDQEYQGVVNALSPDFKVTLQHSQPKGDGLCEFLIERRTTG